MVLLHKSYVILWYLATIWLYLPIVFTHAKSSTGPPAEVPLAKSKVSPKKAVGFPSICCWCCWCCWCIQLLLPTSHPKANSVFKMNLRGCWWFLGADFWDLQKPQWTSVKHSETIHMPSERLQFFLRGTREAGSLGTAKIQKDVHGTKGNSATRPCQKNRDLRRTCRKCA